MQTTTRFTWATAALVAVALNAAGCGSDDGPPPVVVAPSGTLVVDWTLAGAKIPADCSRFGATEIRISIVTEDGLDAGTYAQACETFATSITLAADRYTANALLVDAAGNARTTVLAIQPFSIFGDDQLSVPIDFPENSFYP